MKKKQFILIFILFNVAFSQRRQIDYGNLRDDLLTGSHYAEELTQGLISGNILQSAQNVLGLIGQIHPIAGAVAGAVHFCLSIFGAIQPTENPLLVAVREGVTIICRKLDRISDTIRDLESTIKFEIRGLSLDHQVDDIEGLLLLQQQLIETGETQSFDDFVNSCLLSRIYEKPFWFAKVLTARSSSNLKYLIIEQRDATQLNDYYQRVISVFFQAVILSSSCTAARYRKMSNETVQRYLDLRGDHAEFLLQQIYESMKADADAITRDFIPYSLRDVAKAAAKFEKQDIKLTFEYLNYTLNRKYNYRSWLVVVYGNSETSGSYKHSISPDKNNELIYEKKNDCEGYFHNFIRFHGANFAIGTPTNCTDDYDWKKNVVSCAVNNAIFVSNCGEVDKFLNCLKKKSVRYLVAGCVYEKHYLGYSYTNMVAIELEQLVLYALK